MSESGALGRKYPLHPARDNLTSLGVTRLGTSMGHSILRTVQSSQKHQRVSQTGSDAGTSLSHRHRCYCCCWMKIIMTISRVKHQTDHGRGIPRNGMMERRIDRAGWAPGPRTIIADSRSLVGNLTSHIRDREPMTSASATTGRARSGY